MREAQNMQTHNIQNKKKGSKMVQKGPKHKQIHQHPQQFPSDFLRTAPVEPETFHHWVHRVRRCAKMGRQGGPATDFSHMIYDIWFKNMVEDVILMWLMWYMMNLWWYMELSWIAMNCHDFSSEIVVHPDKMVIWPMIWRYVWKWHIPLNYIMFMADNANNPHV